MSDVWKSRDGKKWDLVTETAFSVAGNNLFSIPRGRGGHQMLAIPDANKVPYLWVFGGRGGDNTVHGKPQVIKYFMTLYYSKY